MKKHLLTIATLFVSMPMFADYGFTINDFTIKAGEEKFVEVLMYHDTEITAFQFDIELPEGVEIATNPNTGNYVVTRTSRLKWEDEYEETVQHNLEVSHPSDHKYRVMAYSSSSLAIQGNSGEAVVKIKLSATDEVSTGNFTPSFTKVEMTEPDATKHKCSDATYNCTVSIPVTVTTLGYASYSWPKALDFTGTGLTAYIVSHCTGSSLTLSPVTKVPANTGLILKGTPGSENTYQLATTTEETEDVSDNLLSANTEEVYTVASDDIYVLSNLDEGQAGFYLASQGIQVAKYKSYLQYASSQAKGLTFDLETTDIQTVRPAIVANNEYYDLQGRHVKNPTKGIYVKGGKKIIFK